MGDGNKTFQIRQWEMETKPFRSDNGRWRQNLSDQTVGDGDKTFEIRRLKIETKLSDQTMGDEDKTFEIRQWEMETKPLRSDSGR